MDTNKRTMLCPKCGAENYSWRSRCQTCNTLLHEEDEVSTANYHRRDYLRWSALITGLTGAGTVTFFVWFLGAFAQGRITRLIDWLFVLGTGLFALGSMAIARKWPLIGGVLLIVEGLVPIGLFVWAGIQSGHVLGVLLFSLIPGLPLLTSGVLYILAWREGRRPSSVAIAGKWPLIGGVLLIVEGLVPIGLLVRIAIAQHGFYFSWELLFFLIPGLLLLASGVLFILAWRKGRRPSKETGS